MGPKSRANKEYCTSEEAFIVGFPSCASMGEELRFEKNGSHKLAARVKLSCRSECFYVFIFFLVKRDL